MGSNPASSSAESVSPVDNGLRRAGLRSAGLRSATRIS